MGLLILVARAAFLIACVFTLVCALTPPEAHPIQLLPWEKANHLLAFYVLSVLAAVSAPRAPLLALGALLVGLGAAIELLQAVPLIHRDPALADVGIDSVAIVAALAPMALGRWQGGRASLPRRWTLRAPAPLLATVARAADRPRG